MAQERDRFEGMAATLPLTPPSGARGLDETRTSDVAHFLAQTGVLTRATSSATEETRINSESGFVDQEGEEPPALRVVAETGRIGRFLVLRELGRGAMGVVFAAYDEELDRKVAIKLLHAGRGGDASLGRSMLLREAQALARLSHPNVVAVHEVGVLEGAVFVAMEYVAGVDLQQWLGAATRPWREVLAVLRQAGLGLVAAHREGMVHRDFKPSNVLVGEDGRVRVADFGLAARRGQSTSRDDSYVGAAVTMTATLTGEGALVGTPVYMAPELLRGGSATAHSDQYAYCVALYEALYGARPYEGDSLAALTDTVERRPLPVAPPRAEVPGWLHAAVLKGLAKAPERRFATLAELVDLLARDPEAEQAQRRRRALQIAGAIAGTVAIVALLVFAGWAVRGYVRARQADGRLAALRGQVAELRARGDDAEAQRLLEAFVVLPENRGVVGRAYLEWAEAQTEPAPAVDAFGSAYIAAGSPAEGRTALRGLIGGLQAQGRVTEAAAALRVLEEEAPEETAAPELQAVRLAAALAQRDVGAARAALAAAEADAGGWSSVLEDLSHTTDISTRLPGLADARGHATVVDFDGDGTGEVVTWDGGPTVRVLRADAGLADLRAVTVGPVWRARALTAVTPGEPLLVTARATAHEQIYELRLEAVQADGTTRALDTWEDSGAFMPWTVDLDGDGRREVYLGTEAYVRRLWRLDREADGTWSRGSPHPATDMTTSDINDVAAMDLDGDGRPELALAMGPWTAYDLRILKPLPGRGLDLVARRPFGPLRSLEAVRAGGGRTLLGVLKLDDLIAPGRFPPDRPLGEPGGVYLVELRGASIEVVAHLGGPVGSAVRDMWAGDLDGDGVDELIGEARDRLVLMRWREGQPVQTLVLAGLRPVMAHDLDGDGRAEIAVALDEQPERVLLLGAGDDPLPPLPPVAVAPRALPDGIADPTIATAWAHAEQLVAIGLPRRTAEDLASIARLSGQVAPDMLYRTGELFAAVGEHAKAAENFAAAATRPDIAGRALAGAAQARRRLGEFAAATELTRQRLAVVEEGERAGVEAELAALEAATAARPTQTLTFTRPLDGRWRVYDPVAVQRALGEGALSVWPGTTSVMAELPLMWDGGPAALEVELEVTRAEWGAGVSVELAAGDRRWVFVMVGGFGLSSDPKPEMDLGLAMAEESDRRAVPGSRLRARVEVFPAFDTLVREVEGGGQRAREVLAITASERAAAPSAGPIQLRIAGNLIAPGFTTHAMIRRIGLEGFTPGEPAQVDDEAARRLVERDHAAAAAMLASAPAGSMRRVWRVDALLGLGRIEEATREIAAVLALGEEDPVVVALYHRLRRGDELAWLAARPAYGPRLVELVLTPGGNLAPRASDVEVALTVLPTQWTGEPADAEALRWRALTRFARGSAHRRAGQLTAARDEYDEALRLLADRREFPERGHLAGRLFTERIDLAVEMDDRESALKWLRWLLMASATPFLSLERLQSEAGLYRLIGAETWAELAREVEADNPRPSAG